MSAAPNIWIPPAARPKYRCLVCKDAYFWEGEERAYQEHVVRCAAEHHDELVAEQQEKRPDFLFKPFDPEWAAWAKETGATSKRRARFVRPGE